MSDKIKVVLDTDIGDDIDDAFALAYLLNSPEIDLVGVTTVFRNTVKRAKMAVKLADSLGYKVDVYAGENNPIKQDVQALLTEAIRANEKVDELGLYLPPQYDQKMDDAKIADEHAVDAIIRLAEKYTNQLTVLCIGPLTNIAKAIERSKAMHKIHRIVLMGGYDANHHPEWNIRCDPEAARVVFTSDIPVWSVGLDVTLQCTLDSAYLNSLKKQQSSAGQLMQQMLTRWFEHYAFDVPVMHDPLAASVLTHDFVSFEPKCVQVDIDHDRGATVVVPEGTPGSRVVQVATQVDVSGFLQIFQERTFQKGGKV